MGLLAGGPTLLGPRAIPVSGLVLDELASDPETVSGGAVRQDVYWKRDGTRAYPSKQGDVIRQYDVSPAWGIQPGDWSSLVATSAITNLRTVWWSPDGKNLSICVRVPSVSVRITVHDQSATPHDLAVLGSSVAKTFAPSGSGGPLDHIWSLDGLRFWVHFPSGAASSVFEYTATAAFDPTTLSASPVASFDFVPDAGTDIRTIGFSNDGTLLYAMDGQVLSSWDLSPAFAVASATNFQAGPSVGVGDLTIPRGLTVRPGNGEIYIAGDQLTDRKMAWFRRP